MRKYFACTIIALALILAGCKAEPATTAPVETAAPTEATVQAVTEPAATTEAPTTEATETTEATQEPTVQDTPVFEIAKQELPYTQKIVRCEQGIYSGPGYDYGSVGTVRKAGIYTIVEEAEDQEGNYWGKLKSGAGWVDLTQIQSNNYPSALIGANYAEDRVLSEVSYHHYSTNREYAVPVIFYAYGTLRDVTIFDVVFQGDEMEAGADLYTVPEMTDAKPLVAELDFPGDMSTYGIRFVDETGATYTYYVYMSGRNGDLVLY